MAPWAVTMAMTSEVNDLYLPPEGYLAAFFCEYFLKVSFLGIYSTYMPTIWYGNGIWCVLQDYYILVLHEARYDLEMTLVWCPETTENKSGVCEQLLLFHLDESFEPNRIS